jgi:hypothetical protein
MTQPEYLAWIEFYRLYPFDDMHRFHRPAALVANSMSGAGVDKLLEWLAPDPTLEKFSEADRATMRALRAQMKG